ncbi:hypothetical protein K493DRAFT_301291 [Basidiobolus meristosporus CBS 931.73]|uniref:LIM-domain binding protein n=1 Tax=Basidiobolus meristosporus CBS 931.73 TaxID=1314790 RepID=A0A1Y1YDR7_9FUNG|nr:hypothetical protein K493DRAFT_301291 [Basidiobolus meristosporus CBS 931.73]|eukprot:ORX95764.1 hypothetical protein K493DRAFT_301291 [Basidiobolus meristosporus CBS 931.73]
MSTTQYVPSSAQLQMLKQRQQQFLANQAALRKAQLGMGNQPAANQGMMNQAMMANQVMLNNQAMMANQAMSGLNRTGQSPNHVPNPHPGQMSQSAITVPQSSSQPMQQQPTSQAGVQISPMNSASPVTTAATIPAPVSRATSVPTTAAGPITSMTLPTGPGSAITKVLQYSEKLVGKSGPSLSHFKDENLQLANHWSRVMSEYFASNGLMKYTLSHSQLKDTRTFGILDPDVFYCIPFTDALSDLPPSLLARFYLINYESGVTDIQLVLENAVEFALPNGYHVVECARAAFVYHYVDGTQVYASGTLKVTLNSQLKFELFEFVTTQHTELLRRGLLLALAQSHNEGKIDIHHLPDSPINDYGVSIRTMRCLEISEVITEMSDLISYSLSSNLGAIQSLQKYGEMLRASGGIDNSSSAGTNGLPGTNQSQIAGVGDRPNGAMVGSAQSQVQTTSILGYKDYPQGMGINPTELTSSFVQQNEEDQDRVAAYTQKTENPHHPRI